MALEISGTSLRVGNHVACECSGEAFPPSASNASSVAAATDGKARIATGGPGRSHWWQLVVCAVAMVIAGCGGSIHPTVSAVTFPNGSISSIAPGTVVALSAVVTNDVKGLGVDWSVTCTPPVIVGGTGSTTPNPCGSFSPVHTVSGAITNYTAPNAIPTGATVTILATATSDTTRTSTTNLTVAGNALTVSVSPAAANISVNEQLQFTDTVTNDPANAGVNWTLSCGVQVGLVCGQLLETQSASGSPVTYVAPAVDPGSIVTITATSITNPTVTAQASITIVPTIVVSFFSTPPPTLAPGSSTSLTAVVANDLANGGVTWTASAGTFSLAQTPSGVATVYTAPSGAANGSQVTITATSVTDPTQSVSATIAISFNITVGISVASSSVHAGSTAAFSATVTNDIANGGVRWSASAGTFNPAQTTSGVTTTYTAPGAIPSGGTVTITATSVTDPTKSATTIVTITAPAIAIAIAPPSASLQVGGITGFVAVVTNDSSNSGVTWSATAGTFNPTQTASGGATLYTAPATQPPSGSVTITATSVADPTKTATATVVISIGAPALSVTISPSTASLQTGATTGFIATVQNDSANGGVTWTASAGTLSPTQTASGATTTYTAPASVPAGGVVTITATSVTDATKTATATVTVSAPNAGSLLNGQYAFAMTGQNSAGGGIDVAYQSYLGSFTADGNGNITAGEVDLNSEAFTNGSLNISGVTGTYSLNADGTGSISLANTAQSFALTLSVAFVKSGHALIMSTADDPNNGVLNGTLDLQTPSSFATPLNGSFAFNFSLPFTGGEEPDTLGGVMTIGAGTITNYVEDENQSGTILSTTSNPASDTFGAPDSNGRGLVTLNTFGAQSGLPFVYYLVDSTHFLIATIQGGGGQGVAYQQPSTLPSSLAGTYVFTNAGFNAGGSITEDIDSGGVLVCDASGNLTSGTLDVNAGGTFTTGSTSGTCALDPGGDGRGTINITSGSTGGVASFAVYPTTNNGLLMVELDSTVAGTGTAYPQASGVAASNFQGSYASSFFTFGSGFGGATTLLGPVTANGTTALNGTVDINDFGEGAATTGATLTGTGVLTDTGTGRLTGEFTTSATTGGSSFVYDLQQVFYIVDANTVLSLESDSNPGTGILQLQNTTTAAARKKLP